MTSDVELSDVEREAMERAWLNRPVMFEGPKSPDFRYRFGEGFKAGLVCARETSTVTDEMPGLAEDLVCGAASNWAKHLRTSQRGTSEDELCKKLANEIEAAVEVANGRSSGQPSTVIDKMVELVRAAEKDYLDGCESARKAHSMRLYGHTGASVPQHAPVHKDRLRAVLRAAGVSESVEAEQKKPNMTKAGSSKDQEDPRTRRCNV